SRRRSRSWLTRAKTVIRSNVRPSPRASEATMKLSTELEIALSLAAREAQRRRHDLMTVEHLLYALLHDEETAQTIKKSGGDLAKLKRSLERVFDEEMQAAPETEDVLPTPSRGFQRVLQRAAWHVESSGKQELKGTNVLVAIFSELDS